MTGQRASPERTKHPAQFPVSVIERIVKACSNRAPGTPWRHPNDLLLDPFIGSGTTAEVAIRQGRHAIGFEINSSYLEIAAERYPNVRENYSNSRDGKSSAASSLKLCITEVACYPVLLCPV